MTNIPIQFIKKKFATVAAAQTYSDQDGRIVFDKQNHVLCVDGDVYGGNIQDVNFDTTTHILTITKADGSTQTLNFSDVASAQGTMVVFNQLRELIGLTTGDETSVQGFYTNTTYLQGAQTLVNADKALDTAIHSVQDKAEAAQGYAETVQGNLEDVEEALQGYIETAQGYIHATQGYVETTQGAINTLQGAVNTLEGNFASHTDDDDGTHKHWAEHIGVQGVTLNGTSLGGDTLEVMQGLASAMQGIVEQGKTYDLVQGATQGSALKTYYLQETVGSTVTNHGVINIPKDFLVKSATVEVCQEDDVPVAGYVQGDKYIDFVINAKEEPGNDEHIYLLVNDLVDVYTAEENASEIQLAIDEHNEISATIVNGSIQGVHIANLAVGEAALQNGAVTSGKIANGAVNTVQMADGAVTSAKIADGAVTSVQLANGAVTSDKIGANQVQSSHLQGGSVTREKLGLQSVGSENIGQNQVQGWHLQDGSITSDKLDIDDLVTVHSVQSIVVNDDTNGYTGNTIATIGGKDIKVKADMYWSEWDDTDPSNN